VDLVDVGFFGSEVNVFFYFFANLAEERVIDEGRDDLMFIRSRRGVFCCVLLEYVWCEQTFPEVLLYLFV
jgi:hypothetical protein